MKKSWLVVLSLILIFSVGGCSQPKKTEQPAQTGYPLVLTDYSQQKITIKAKPERIISLAPSNTEILFALGLDQQIVGVTNYCDYPAAAKSKEKIGDTNVNIEKIVALKPDLVVAGATMNGQAIKALRDLGVTVMVVEPQNVDQVFKTIHLIAQATGTQAQAEQVIGKMRQTLADVESKLSQVRPEERAKVFIEVGYDPLYTAGKGSFVDDLVRLAGGKNIASDVTFYKQYSLENLLAKNPDIILATDYYYLKDNQKINQRSGWAKIKAVKDGHIIGDIDSNLLTRPSPRSAEAVQAIAKAFYPDLFK